MAATMFTPFEPKATNRFVMTINGFAAYLIHTTDTPNYDTGEIVIDYVNVDFKVKSKTRWSDINISLYDPVTPQGSQMVHTWLDLMHKSDNGVDGFAFSDYKKDITIDYLDPKGSEIGTWTLYGAFPATSNWGSLDWKTGEAVIIEVGLKYDYARLS